LGSFVRSGLEEERRRERADRKVYVLGFDSRQLPERQRSFGAPSQFNFEEGEEKGQMRILKNLEDV